MKYLSSTDMTCTNTVCMCKVYCNYLIRLEHCKKIGPGWDCN